MRVAVSLCLTLIVLGGVEEAYLLEISTDNGSRR